MRTPADVLRTHVDGEMKDFAAATQASERWPAARNPSDFEIFGELRRRSVNRLAPGHDGEWLFDVEVRYVLQAA
jgi:hypothetical protein